MQKPAHIVVSTALSCALTLGAGTLLAPCAYADDVQTDLENAQAAYAEAQQQVNDIQAQIDENQQKIDELNVQLPGLKEGAASSIRTQYMMQQSSGSLIDLILSADSFNDFIASIQYLDVISSKTTDSISELTETANELSQAQDELEAQQQAALDAQADAEEKLASARAAAEKVAEEAAAQQAAEEQEAQEAQEQAQEAAGTTFTTASGTEATVEASTTTNSSSSSDSSSSQAIESNVSQDESSSWAQRIDAFLAGTPLAGQGATFAAAAAAYGVDPRVSPAIAMVESGGGAICFRSHNAWGWGSSSWSSWEEAIYAHVRGFASGYGSTVTPSVARKYCPPNSSYWYSSVINYMNQI